MESLNEFLRDSIEDEDNITIEKKVVPDYSDSTNYFDENGMKQGKYIEKDRFGKTIKVETYRNDTIHGYWFIWEGMRQDGIMQNGKKQGNFNMYYGDNRIMSISHFDDDSLIWVAPYIANQNLVVPVKYIAVFVDSIYLEVPHPNNKLWYEGLFINQEPLGIHKVYYDFGKLKGTINYGSLEYTQFDSTGIEMLTKKFKKLPTKK